MALGLFMIIAGTAGGAITMVKPWNRGIDQSFNAKMPNELIGVLDIVSARYRGLATKEQYDNELVRQGLDDNRREWLYKIAEGLLNIMELINLFRRGAIDQETLYKQGEVLAWNNDKIDQLLRVTEIIPSAQDIIAFAVREVYSPEIAEAFGQFEGLDAVYEKAQDDIIAIGMSKETFGKYWAAHWILPSIGQGFEMLHRGVIPFSSTPQQPLSLERLLTALDVMPAWREPLTAISYNPYTRVDVRRMNKMGTISDEELITAYKDLGYDDVKAAKMADFTIKYNAEPEEAEQSESYKRKIYEKDLTKTDILNGYRDALLLESEAKQGLVLLKYDSNEIDYYISKVNYDKEKDETDNYLRYYHDAYIKRVMSHNDLVDKLGALNLSGKRIEYLFKVWDLERTARTTKPTKSELFTFFRKKIITKEVLIEEMKGLNYPPKYIEWYVKAG